MPIRLDTREPPPALFRVGRKPDVWAWTDRAYIGQGRWDSPDKSYVVLYASGRAFGAYLEALAPFQPDLSLLAELARVRSNARGLPATRTAPQVPANWRATHLLGRAVPDRLPGSFVVVGAAQTLSTLRRRFAGRARAFGIPEIDAGVIRLDHSTEFRQLTQAVSQYLFEQRQADGRPYAGIFYLGQHGDEVENYAIFQRSADCPVSCPSQASIAFDDADFRRACELLGLEPR